LIDYASNEISFFPPYNDWVLNSKLKCGIEHHTLCLRNMLKSHHDYFHRLGASSAKLTFDIQGCMKIDDQNFLKWYLNWASISFVTPQGLNNSTGMTRKRKGWSHLAKIISMCWYRKFAELFIEADRIIGRFIPIKYVKGSDQRWRGT
jgi:hypothetical protein